MKCFSIKSRGRTPCFTAVINTCWMVKNIEVYISSLCHSASKFVFVYTFRRLMFQSAVSESDVLLRGHWVSGITHIVKEHIFVHVLTAKIRTPIITQRGSNKSNFTASIIQQCFRTINTLTRSGSTQKPVGTHVTKHQSHLLNDRAIVLITLRTVLSLSIVIPGCFS